MEVAGYPSEYATTGGISEDKPVFCTENGIHEEQQTLWGQMAGCWPSPGNTVLGPEVGGGLGLILAQPRKYSSGPGCGWWARPHPDPVQEILFWARMWIVGWARS